jgi:hypothetical protein
MSTNQAVLFTKPLHHLGIDLEPKYLAQRVRSYFEGQGMTVVSSRQVSGPELAERAIIRRHYMMYSKASYGDIDISAPGRARFNECFGASWNAEIELGRIMGNPQLLKTKGMDAHRLFSLWNATAIEKIQPGLLMGRLEELDCFCINAFYPAMEANFYHADTRMDYFVVEFESTQVSWQQFRKELLGATDAGKAGPGSLRGLLYAEYKVEYPGRDNFVHGSAGPLEGLVERCIHEPDIDWESNPVGQYLAGRGFSRSSFAEWKAAQSVSDIGQLFDATEGKDTADVLPILDEMI